MAPTRRLARRRASEYRAADEPPPVAPPPPAQAATIASFASASLAPRAPGLLSDLHDTILAPAPTAYRNGVRIPSRRSQQASSAREPLTPEVNRRATLRSRAKGERRTPREQTTPQAS